jgi:hypothetical protein
MKRKLALTALAILTQAVLTFAGEPQVSSKNVILPPATPASFYRANEWDVLSEQVRLLKNFAMPIT